MTNQAERVEIQNVLSPNHTMRVDRVKYQEMRKALLKVLPMRAPGLTVAEVMTALLPHLSEELFPGGSKAGWWNESGPTRSGGEGGRDQRAHEAAAFASELNRVFRLGAKSGDGT